VNHLLGLWHAQPLAPDTAHQLLDKAQQRQQRGQRLRRCRTGLLQEMIARHWLGTNAMVQYPHLLPPMQASPHAHALLELITGQLLISQRSIHAWAYLERGFHLASRLFTPTDYLAVLNRHQTLRHLPLNEQTMPAATLDALLTTARVIERMRKGERPQGLAHDPSDLLG
jgi:hypothetical protein